MHDNPFPKTLRLRSRLDYKNMASRNKRHHGTFFIMDIRKNKSSVTRLGITVSKRFGNAPQRNRFKRIVREAFRLSYQDLIKGIDLNIRPYPKTYQLTMLQVQAEILHLLKNE